EPIEHTHMEIEHQSRQLVDGDPTALPSKAQLSENHDVIARIPQFFHDDLPFLKLVVDLLHPPPQSLDSSKRLARDPADDLEVGVQHLRSREIPVTPVPAFKRLANQPDVLLRHRERSISRTDRPLIRRRLPSVALTHIGLMAGRKAS